MIIKKGIKKEAGGERGRWALKALPPIPYPLTLEFAYL